MISLTERQLQVLKVVERSICITGFAPVTSDIASTLSISSGAVVSAMTGLELKGYIKRGTIGKSTYRTIKLSSEAYEALGLPCKQDPKIALAKIIEAWDAPHSPAWADALEASIEAARVTC